MVCSMLNREVHLFLLSIVPVANAIKVAVADIVTGYFADPLIIALDLTVDIVLLLEHVSAVVNVSRQAVGLIFELLLSLALMTERSHKESIYLVPVVVENDFTAIREGHCALTNVINICALQSCFYAPFHYAGEVIVRMVDYKA